MNLPSRTRLKKRDITLNPLSDEWIRRKATPFGVRLLEGKNVRERPDYTNQVFTAGARTFRIHPLALQSTHIPIRRLISEARNKSRPLPLALETRTKSVRDVMGRQLEAAKKDDMANATGRL